MIDFTLLSCYVFRISFLELYIIFTHVYSFCINMILLKGVIVRLIKILNIWSFVQFEG